jgi:hypothetical protein
MGFSEHGACHLVLSLPCYCLLRVAVYRVPTQGESNCTVALVDLCHHIHLLTQAVTSLYSLVLFFPNSIPDLATVADVLDTEGLECLLVALLIDQGQFVSKSQGETMVFELVNTNTKCINGSIKTTQVPLQIPILISSFLLQGQSVGVAKLIGT